jgi:hypothetical protein
MDGFAIRPTTGHERQDGRPIPLATKCLLMKLSKWHRGPANPSTGMDRDLARSQGTG